ncbi:glycosyltransferase [Verrucomicrobiota bacterium sgz303538]
MLRVLLPMSSGDQRPNSSNFIFLDPQGRRWPRLRLSLVAGSVLLVLGIVLFLMAVWVRPAVRLPQAVRQLKGQLKAEARAEIQTAPPDYKANSWQQYLAHSRAAQDRFAKLRKDRQEKREVRLGFYVDWDANSGVSLREHASELTHVAPEWFSIEGPEGRLVLDADPALATFCAARGITTMPLLRNLVGNTWQPEAVENLARGPAQDREHFIRELTAQLQRLGAGGVLLDWNELDPAYRDDYTALLSALATALHSAGRELWLAVSMGDELKAFDLDALAEHVDHFVALLIDEHAEADEPGPLASQEWLEGWLKVLTEYGEISQWIVALGSYATDWNTTRGDAESISFRDAMSRASYAGVEGGSGASVAGPHFNGRYVYSEETGEHTVSFLDAISFYDQLAAKRDAGFKGIALYRLGTEDPQIWDVLRRTAPADAAFAKTLSHLRTDQSVTHVGRGEIVSVDLSRDDGDRAVVLTEEGKLQATYTDFPTYPVLYHQGAGDKHAVSITFDDGPDPVWTPKVLDILKRRGVKATFFVVGRNAEDHPDLVRRIIAEGHEIGNHTYTHGNLAVMPEWRMRLELDATERLIESLTGVSTMLFRPPYNADSTPSNVDELVPLQFAEKELGYTVVLEKIDPQDWAKPGADTILQRVKDQRTQGNVILLHDAGGDRRQTVEALPRILDWLEERGDRVVSLSELVHIPREELMPQIQPSAQPGVRAIAGTGFRLWHWLVEFLWAFMMVATVLVVTRALLIAWLAWRHRRIEEKLPPVDLSAAPAVSVLIAAYNEGKVIEKTLRSLLDTDYPGELEVVVVNDGSKDDTAQVVEQFAATESRVRFISQANAGKSAALRNALAHARHEIVVFLDADTLFERQTISRLVEKLVADPKVASVSGHARVGNRDKLVTRFQELEYISGFNLDRRAYTLWNCVTVVPGAVSALRRSAIEEAGGFSHDTLAEDTDMTLTLHKLGYRISYAPNAIAWTEAPETWSALAKQRFRWAFGTMQCLWKHREMLFNPRHGALGLFSLPSVWFFQVILVAITPIADAILLWSILFGYAGALWPYFALFLFLDLLLAALACRLEQEPLRRSLLIIPMRLVYRWLLARVIWKSISRAFKGALVGWGKLERTASVPSRA